MLSLGEFVNDFSSEDVMNGFPKLQNNALGRGPEYMKDVEGWGGGVSRYFEKYDELGLPSPKVEELDGGFFRQKYWARCTRN